MTREEANELIGNNLKQIQKLFDECKDLSNEHKVSFKFNVTKNREAGFTYNCDIENHDDMDEDEKEYFANRSEEEKIYWHASSLNC